MHTFKIVGIDIYAKHFNQRWVLNKKKKKKKNYDINTGIIQIKIILCQNLFLLDCNIVYFSL